MNFHEVCIGVETGQITFDYAGHTCNDAKQRFLGGAYQGLRKTNQDILDQEVLPGQDVEFYCLFEETFCFHCGEKLRFVLEDNVLALRSRYVNDPNARFGVRKESYPREYRCSWEKPRPFCGEINVEQALVFANYFEMPDTPKGDEYSDKWNLCSISGRYKRAEYKCKNYNVAYGQMSNMSIGIYLHKDNNIIIVGPAYHPVDFTDLTDEEYKVAINKPVFEDFTLINSISLDVWRWEATDLKTIGKENYNSDRDLVKLKVNPGIWKFEHYFDYLTDETDYIYAKLWLSS